MAATFGFSRAIGFGNWGLRFRLWNLWLKVQGLLGTGLLCTRPAVKGSRLCFLQAFIKPVAGTGCVVQNFRAWVTTKAYVFGFRKFRAFRIYGRRVSQACDEAFGSKDLGLRVLGFWGLGFSEVGFRAGLLGFCLVLKRL